MPRVSGLLGGWTVSGLWGPCLPHAKTLSLGQMASQWFIAERSDVSLYFCEACFFFGGADGDVDGLVLSMLRGWSGFPRTGKYPCTVCWLVLTLAQTGVVRRPCAPNNAPSRPFSGQLLFSTLSHRSRERLGPAVTVLLVCTLPSPNHGHLILPLCAVPVPSFTCTCSD